MTCSEGGSHVFNNSCRGMFFNRRQSWPEQHGIIITSEKYHSNCNTCRFGLMLRLINFFLLLV